MKNKIVKAYKEERNNLIQWLESLEGMTVTDNVRIVDNIRGVTYMRDESPITDREYLQRVHETVLDLLDLLYNDKHIPKLVD